LYKKTKPRITQTKHQKEDREKKKNCRGGLLESKEELNFAKKGIREKMASGDSSPSSTIGGGGEGSVRIEQNGNCNRGTSRRKGTKSGKDNDGKISRKKKSDRGILPYKTSSKSGKSRGQGGKH